MSIYMDKVMDRLSYKGMLDRELWKRESIAAGRPCSIIQIVKRQIELANMPPQGDSIWTIFG